MQRSKLKRALLATVALSAVFLLPQAATAGSNPNPQTPGSKVAAAPVPDQCVHMHQPNYPKEKYRLGYNAPVTYTSAVYGSGWFNVKCGKLSFTVPRGQDSMVDFTAAAELDCDAPNNVTSPTPTNGWCEARFQVNAVNVLPNNTDRGDTFAWDSSNGGTFDWQANTLEQFGHAFCPRSPDTSAPCLYWVVLQGRLNNGATSLWVDDLTVRVDVTTGPVKVTTLTP